jgi:hypothetical protein
MISHSGAYSSVDNPSGARGERGRNRFQSCASRAPRLEVFDHLERLERIAGGTVRGHFGGIARLVRVDG